MSTTIRMRPNGPLLVEGPVTVLDSNGNAFPLNPDKPAIALCRCGHSANKPFCDGSHKGTGLSPLQYVARRDQTVYFCGCKQTKNKPLCDGTHNDL